MKKLIQYIVRFLIIGVLFFTSTAQAAPETFTFDPTHSYILWHISHFGFSNPSGKWMFTGTLVLDEANPQNSNVKATVNVADVVTGIPKLDEHLRKADFFDVTTFPTATFVSNKVVITGKDTAQVYGMLNLHGVSKPVMLNVKLNKAAMSPITQKMTAGFTATTQLQRSDFGINAYLPGLGDAVKINIEAEAYKA